VNVYDQIAANNRRTVMILCAFPAALFVLVFSMCFLIVKTGIPTHVEAGFLYIFMNKENLMLGRSPVQMAALPPMTHAFLMTLMIYPWMILGTFLWIAFSYYKGDDMILWSARAHPVTLGENRELFRLDENTAIMAGLPTPKIYLIDDESLNALATGRKPETASVALTRGIVEKLGKLELQAVIAHELSHIGNRDTRLMMITVAGIGCFIFFGEMLIRGAFHSMGRNRSRRSGSGRTNVLFFVLGLCCLVFGYIVAPILRFALSRRREYQADATAAKITHDPGSLARALEKISEDPRVEVLDSSPMVGNLCIADPAGNNGFVKFVSSLYATHPPIGDRIRLLEKMLGKRTLGRVVDDMEM
jgi:heat shock protein HtpX